MSTSPTRLSPPLYVVLSGPSAAGKSTIVRRLLAEDPEVRLSVSVTTRPPRPGERDGREYHFVDREEFLRRRAAGEFVEWAEVHDHLYGTPHRALAECSAAGVDALFDIDFQGGLAIKRAYPVAVAIFLLPPSMAVLERRLRQRASDDQAQIALRLEVAGREMAQAEHYDFVVINDELERTYAQVTAILQSERLRVARIEPERLAALVKDGSARHRS